MKSNIKNFILHETKKHVLLRFILLFSVLILYFLFISFKFGVKDSIIITILTWSFFVFCTPIADAGFLLDFPVRLITGIRMIYSEMIVWVVATTLNILMILFNPSVYNRTLLLKLFKFILFNPFPFWAIIFLSAVGTYLSIYFADELIDVSKHKDCKKYHKHASKYQLVIFLFLIIFIIFLYDFLLKSLGVNILN